MTEGAARKSISRVTIFFPPCCAYLSVANARKIVVNLRGQRLERNYSPWPLFLKPSLRGAPPNVVFRFQSGARTGYAVMFTVMHVKNVRQSDFFCVGLKKCILLTFAVFFVCCCNCCGPHKIDSLVDTSKNFSGLYKILQ